MTHNISMYIYMCTYSSYFLKIKFLHIQELIYIKIEILNIITNLQPSTQRPSERLNKGHLSLTALQIRGHAMFSNKGLSLTEETMEYAWIVELTLGFV